jgi:hypothetical protein
MGTSGAFAQSTGASIFVDPLPPLFRHRIGNAPPKRSRHGDCSERHGGAHVSGMPLLTKET